jgi:hypothetical protein
MGIHWREICFAVVLLAGGATVAGHAVEIGELYADPDHIDPGDTSSLRWKTTGATKCTLTPPGTSDLNLPDGSFPVNPPVETTYRLQCEGQGAPATAYVTVAVTPAVSIQSFKAAPEFLSPGGTSNLSWTTLDAVSCQIPGIGSVPVNCSGCDKGKVMPQSTTTYLLQCRGKGTTRAEAVAKVSVVGPPVILLQAQPNQIPCGGTTNVTWSTTDAVHCQMDPWAITVTVQGSMKPQLDKTVTFKLTCWNAANVSTQREAGVAVETCP